jgi:hypothetical protein
MGTIIRSAPFGVFLAMVAIPLLMAGVAVFAGLRARQRAALVDATPKANIAFADNGYRQLEGTVEPIAGMPVVAPLTKTPCAWFYAKVEEYVPERQRSRQGGREWRIVTEVVSETPFLLRDATGSCAVHPARAEVTPTDRSLWYGATAEPVDTNPPKVGPGDAVKPMLEVKGGPNSRYRYSEDRIYAGNRLFVQGAFSTGLVIEHDEDVAEEEVDVDEEEQAVQDAAGTKASIRNGSGAPPFIMSTTARAEHVAKMALGGSAALGIAAVPLAIAVLVVWVRFS